MKNATLNFPMEATVIKFIMVIIKVNACLATLKPIDQLKSLTVGTSCNVNP